jgi:sugar/nucleoside kinase (ribokinase family)
VNTIPPYSIGCGDALDGTLLAARLAGAGSEDPPQLEHILQTAVAVAADVARRPLGDTDALPGAYTLGL